MANISPHIFQTFWWGDALSPYEMLCLKSFVDHGHQVHLYSYTTQLTVPEGVVVRDAAALIAGDRFFAYESGAEKGSPAAFANLFRYRLLAARGGWWIDTDVVCLSDEIPVVDRFFAFQDQDFVNNAVMFFKADHAAMVRCQGRAEQLGSAVRWGETGPLLLTKVVADLGCIDQAYAPSVCYPVHYSQALDMLKPTKTAAILERSKSSLLLHLWNEMLRRNGVRKEWLPPRGSALRHLIDRHHVGGWQGEYEPEAFEDRSDGSA